MKIKKIKIQNFKGIQSLDVNFEKVTNIYGANATGKSTIFDAFCWVLTGKDSKDRADFEIKPLDSANNPTHMIESIVELETDTIQLKKIFKEKWTKKRGQEEQNFSGHETEYFVDDVPMKKKDFETKLNEIIPEKIFKLISNPLYFSEILDWKKRREILFEIAGNISDEEVIESNSKLEILKELLKENNIDDFKAKIQYAKKKLKQEKENIPARVDELQKTINIEFDKEKLNAEKKELEAVIEKLNNELQTDTASDIEKNLYKEISILRKEIAEINVEETLSENRRIEKTKSEINIQEKYKAGLDKELYKLQAEYNSFEKILQKEELLIELRKEFVDKQKELHKIEPDKTCPTCSQKIPVELQAEKQEKIKQEELKKISEKGNGIKKEIIEAKEKITEIEKDILILQEKISEVSKIIKQYENSMQQKLFVENKEISSKEFEISKLEKELEKLEKKDKTETLQHKARVENLIKDINVNLAKIESQEINKIRIEELVLQEKEISKKIIEIEQQEYLTEEFLRCKVELIEKNINSKFEIVKFKLFQEQVNGGVQEICEVLLDGVPFSQVNTAGRIQAGIDIINTLNKYYNVECPVFIDNRESITDITENNLQIVNLIVDKNKNKLEVV